VIEVAEIERRPTMRRGRPLALVLAVVLALGLATSSCTVSTVITPIDPALEAFPITDNRPDRYAVVVEDGAIVTSADPANTGGNTRIVFWPRGQAQTADQQVCATWRSATLAWRQEGIVLRLRFDQGAGQGILITKNVWAGTFWTINVSKWRATDAPQAVTLLDSFDLSDALGTGDDLAPLPWRMCARVVDATVSFVVWPLSEPRPDWDDPLHSGEVLVPADLTEPGVGGWFVGHLLPGQNLVYDDLTVGPPGTDD
jgi:hypothetical protein